MSFTTAYGLRLAAWGLLLATLLGGPVLLSWRWWDRTLGGASAHKRHRVACGHFFSLLVLPGAAVGGVHLTLAAMGTEIFREPPHPSDLFAVGGPGAGWLASMIVAVWLAGASLTMIRLAAQAWRLHRLRRVAAPGSLVNEVRSLASRLPGTGRLSVWTARVPVPQVMGVVRPTLIVPAGFDRLPAAEREGVLLHELAHVARHDFSVNLLLRLALAALWFQPAARAIYRHVSREREACCDQLAVSRGASVPALARALVRLAEGPLVPVALAVVGHGDLRWRIERLMTPERTAQTSRRRPAALLGLLALASCGLGGARLPMADRAMTDLYIASALGPVVAVRAHDPGGTFSLRIRHGHVLEAAVGDRFLPPTSIRQHGDQVTLLGVAKEPLVSLRVTPSGRIEWQARLAQPPRT